MNQPRVLDLALVTGMSGAGRSTAARSLEDLGWFVIDNLPPSLLLPSIDLLAGNPDVRKVAVVVDVRGGSFFGALRETVRSLPREGIRVRTLFLEASDEALVRRFESSRRPHPLQRGGRIVDGLRAEREVLSDLRADADLVIDTTALNVHELRRKVESAFADGEDPVLRMTVLSFGFKYGIPVDADMVADVRFLPNPHWDDALRPLTGLDAPVSSAVIGREEAEAFLREYTGLLLGSAPGFLAEGKRYLTVAIGCTGGKHRSVAMAEALAQRLTTAGVPVLVLHRDLGRE